MRESFGKIGRVPGVLAFPVMPQGIRTGGIESPVQFVILGNTYDQLIKWKEIIKKEELKSKNPYSVRARTPIGAKARLLAISPVSDNNILAHLSDSLARSI